MVLITWMCMVSAQQALTKGRGAVPSHLCCKHTRSMFDGLDGFLQLRLCSSSPGHTRFADFRMIRSRALCCCSLRSMKFFGTSCPRACRLLSSNPASHARTYCAHSVLTRSFVKHINAQSQARSRFTVSHAGKLYSTRSSKRHVPHASAAAAAAEAPSDTQEAEEGKHSQRATYTKHQHVICCILAASVCITFRTPCSETEAILLEVSGMKCGGCSSAVKRILLGNPEIKSAAVNLLTESAVFKIPAKSDKSTLAEEAAALLTKQVTYAVISCMFLHTVYFLYTDKLCLV